MAITINAKDFINPLQNLSGQDIHPADREKNNTAKSNTFFAGDVRFKSMLEQKKESGQGQ